MMNFKSGIGLESSAGCLIISQSMEFSLLAILFSSSSLKTPETKIINVRIKSAPLSIMKGKKYPPIENKNGLATSDKQHPTPAQAEHVLAYLSNSDGFNS